MTMPRTARLLGRPLGRLRHLPPRLQAKGPKAVAALVERYEGWATDPWAAGRLFDAEIFTRHIIEPGVGTGVLARAALDRGYEVAALDVYDWGWPGVRLVDWRKVEPEGLPWRPSGREFSVVCNPPFTLTGAFVGKALALGARKVAAFAKMEFMGTLARRPWLDRNPPSRVWLCGTRATCWRFDVPPERRNGSTPTLHAWFVWERHHAGAPVIRNIWED